MLMSLPSTSLPVELGISQTSSASVESSNEPSIHES